MKSLPFRVFFVSFNARWGGKRWRNKQMSSKAASRWRKKRGFEYDWAGFVQTSLRLQVTWLRALNNLIPFLFYIKVTDREERENFSIVVESETCQSLLENRQHLFWGGFESPLFFKASANKFLSHAGADVIVGLKRGSWAGGTMVAATVWLGLAKRRGL